MRSPNHFLIWLYFWLLILEGPLRKWLLPGLSEPLLVVRDPVLLLIYIIALKENRFPLNGWILSTLLLSVLSVIFCGLLQSIPPLVMVYGVRTLFLHVPLIFIIPMYLKRDDVIRHGCWVLILLIPQALLMSLQFTLPPEHMLNAGAGGSLGTQMEGAMGKIRPPGLFSFITGAAQFIPLATVFVLHGFIIKKYYPRFLIMGGSLLIMLCLIVSISRLAIGGTLIVLAMVVVISLVVGHRQLKVISRIFLPLIILGWGLSRLDIFEEGQEAFSERLTRTGDLQVGISGTAMNWYQRYFNELTSGVFLLDDVKILGSGLGMGTNVGAKYITGRQQFMLSEGEWGRIVAELGPIIGFAVIILRVLLALTLLKYAFRALRQGNLLPILLWGACGTLVINGQWGQSTTLGFAIWISGIMLAACRIPEEERV